MTIETRTFAICERCKRETLIHTNREGDKRNTPAENAEGKPKPWMRVFAFSCSPQGGEIQGPKIGDDPDDPGSSVLICHVCTQGLMAWWTEVETPR